MASSCSIFLLDQPAAQLFCLQAEWWRGLLGLGRTSPSWLLGTYALQSLIPFLRCHGRGGYRCVQGSVKLKGVNVGWEQSRWGKNRAMAADQATLIETCRICSNMGRKWSGVREKRWLSQMEKWRKYFKAILLLFSQRHALHSHIFPITLLFLVIYFAPLISVPLWWSE